MARGEAEIREWIQRLPYTAISIERQGCFGLCPVYTATIKFNGDATYHGGRYAERLGPHVSFGVRIVDFAHLSRFIERSGILRLAARYEAPWTDAETVVLRVTSRDGTVTTIEDYGHAGPTELWMVQMTIDQILDRLTWIHADDR